MEDEFEAPDVMLTINEREQFGGSSRRGRSSSVKKKKRSSSKKSKAKWTSNIDESIRNMTDYEEEPDLHSDTENRGRTSNLASRRNSKNDRAFPL